MGVGEDCREGSSREVSESCGREGGLLVSVGFFTEHA